MCRINYADSHQVVYRSLDVQTVAPRKGLKRNEIRCVGPAPASVICICMRLGKMAPTFLTWASALTRVMEVCATESAERAANVFSIGVAWSLPEAKVSRWAVKAVQFRGHSRGPGSPHQ